MSGLRVVGQVTGWTCAVIGAVQLLGGVRGEPGMSEDATIDSHVRFMGSVFMGYSLGWLDASTKAQPDLSRMRVLAGLMAVGGLGRLITRATLGRPHRFHDVLLVTELCAPIVVEAVARADRASASPTLSVVPSASVSRLA